MNLTGSPCSCPHARRSSAATSFALNPCRLSLTRRVRLRSKPGRIRCPSFLARRVYPKGISLRSFRLIPLHWRAFSGAGAVFSSCFSQQLNCLLFHRGDFEHSPFPNKSALEKPLNAASLCFSFNPHVFRQLCEGLPFPPYTSYKRSGE